MILVALRDTLRRSVETALSCRLTPKRVTITKGRCYKLLAFYARRRRASDLEYMTRITWSLVVSQRSYRRYDEIAV